MLLFHVFASSALALSLLTGPAVAQVASPPLDSQPYQTLAPRDEVPMPLPQVDLPDLETLQIPPYRSLQRTGRDVPGQRTGRDVPGRPPTIDPFAAPDLDAWLDAVPADEDLLSPLGLEPLQVAPRGWPFTTSRVFPKAQLLSYPYTTIGRLSSTAGTCSGAVIQRRLVLTAGHCVYDALNRQWYTEHVFRPAFYDAATPFDSWFGSRLVTTNDWIEGGERFPNRGDFGIVVVNDRFIGDRFVAIGEVTGWLGSKTSVVQEHFTQFGYPFNLDNTFRPQKTTAQLNGALNDAVLWGTNQLQGSSGGPLIMNFGENASGQNSDLARVIGVVSFGDDTQGIAGSSILRANFSNMVRRACSLAPGNCS